jgi:aryl carrier-like protein
VNVSGFIQNPYTKTTDDIIYRTGDLGRWRPDGMLEVLGRIDDEIKINGVRIQPAEVERVLSGHPLVYACTVIPFKEPNSEPRLVAYVVSTDTNPNFTERIRTYVSQHLPQALVPGQFIRINVLPMTVNGKIERAALPSPLSISNSGVCKSELPSTSIQKEIASIWAEVLERPVFGTSDNFFELGGTSLKLLRLHHRLNLRFPDMIRVAQLFSSPTIAEQAQLIESDAAEQLYNEVTVHEL